MAKYYFLASCLPAMPLSLGERVSLSFPEICQLIVRNIEPEDEPLVRSCLFAVDTSNMEFFLQGQDVFLQGGTLTREEIEGKRHLPPFMKAFLDDRDRGIRRGYEYDLLWERYYAYAYSLAEELDCRFLIGYLSWEIGLRNSLVALRARALGHEAEDYRLVTRIGAHDFSVLLSQLKMQRNPLKAEQLLDEERLRRIYHCESPDPFSRDAILGALERARIYSRWERLSVSYELRDVI